MDQIVGEAVEQTVLDGLLALQSAKAEQDPSTAAECCLSASRHFAMAVSVASADLVEATT